MECGFSFFCEVVADRSRGVWILSFGDECGFFNEGVKVRWRFRFILWDFELPECWTRDGFARSGGGV